MPEYQFANRNGEIVTEDYDRNTYFSANQVMESLRSAFQLFPYTVDIEQVTDYDDVFHVTYPNGDGFGEIFICGKGTTPGGRQGLKDEQRIQPKAKYLNYVYDRYTEGKKGVFLGVYSRDGQTVFCTWKVMQSNAASPETPISKQIKIDSIAKAMQEGFVQHDKGRGEYACAFKPEFLYFYLKNSDWLHNGAVTELSEHTAPEQEPEEEFDENTVFEQLMSLENKDFVFACLNLMKEKNLFNETSLAILQSKEECAAKFKHNSANGILYKIDKSKTAEEQDAQKQGSDGRSRYYNDRYAIGNDEYFVSSEWRPITETENPREDFVRWIFSLIGGLKFHTGLVSEFSRNRILFGAPGTGKSFTINRDRKKLLGDKNEVDYERVTFHPDYSYANFVGTYKPVMVVKKEKPLDKDTDYVISVLNDKGKTAQEKYDILFERFKDEGLTRLPVLLGLYTDELFKTRKQDGSDAAGDNSVERNHGRAIRKYVSLLTGQEITSDIAYEYVPGPFMRVYVNALKNARTGKPKPHLLIIEEINRANVAAVFGDVFQLLDRGDDEVSEYPIQASEDIKNYLAKELGGEPDDYSKIRIPDNMFIWATMNSADQGVFPMDTAFKRRWDFTYLGIDDSDKDIRGKYVTVGSKEKQRIEWNELRKAINEFLADEKINEDKQLGPYFISRNIVVPASGNEIDSKRFCDVFKHKVLMYLFDDAAKQKRAKLFEGSAKGQARYSKICEAFDEQGIGIFHADIQNRVKIQDLVINEHEVDENGMIRTETDTDSEE